MVLPPLNDLRCQVCGESCAAKLYLSNKKTPERAKPSNTLRVISSQRGFQSPLPCQCASSLLYGFRLFSYRVRNR
jgi:hypothetical protein